jgi:hypothetical protein
MKLRRKIGSNIIVVHVSDDLGPMAEDLLSTLQKLDDQGPALAEGSRIAYGWSVLTLEEGFEPEQTLWVREPYFDEDPVRQTQTGITNTARVIVDQGAVCKSVGAEPTPAWYTHDVQLAPGVLDKEQVYLQRRPPASDHDSGWYIGPVTEDEDNKSGELETLAVWQVFQRRRSLLDAMGLPVGYLAVFIDSYIDAILDPHNKEVFRAADVE